MFRTGCSFQAPRSQEACDADYTQLRATSCYPSSSGARIPTASECATHFQENVPTGTLAVVTGVFCDSVAFHAAQELAMRGVHVILLGKSVSELERCEFAIMKRRPQGSLYTVKLKLDCFLSILQATDEIKAISRDYSDTISLLLNLSIVGTDQARLTLDGLEYNTGCNFVGTHFFTKNLLELFDQGSRVVNANSMGHCCGTNFMPQRLVDFPEQGGAPEGFLQLRNEAPANAGALLLQAPTIQVEEKEATYSAADHQEAVRQRGTQVGRSKMALLADTLHMNRIYDGLFLYSIHLQPASGTSKVAFFAKSKNSQAAVPVLRAALDPHLPSGSYLHSDGQPWTAMSPADNEQFGEACYEAAEVVIERVLASLGPTELQQSEGKGDEYEPPTLT